MRQILYRSFSALVLSLACAAACQAGDDESSEHDKVVKLATFEWNAFPEAWEPAANPAISIAGHRVSRPRHLWATFAPSVAFECQLRGTKVLAVNPVPNEPRPRITPRVWNTAAAISILGLPGVSLQQSSVGAVTDSDSKIMSTTPGCFTIDWSARFEKTGTVFSYTPPVGGGPNLLSPRPFEKQLDEDMDDKLTGMVRICCCTWDESIPVYQEGEGTAAESETVENTIDRNTAIRTGKAQDLEGLYGVDWTAEKVRDPHTWGDIQTDWKGSYELKKCTYSTIGVTMPDRSVDIRRKKSKDYDPTDEEADADNIPLGGL